MIVPVWNRASTLQRTLASLLAQTEGDLEIVVVDNGSDDPEAVQAVVAAFGDPRISLVRLAANTGPGGGRNAGAERSSAPLVGFVDSDDEVDPEWHAEMAGPFIDQSVGFATCGLRKVDTSGRVLKEEIPDAEALGACGTPALFRAGTVLIRRSLFVEAGGYDQRFWFAENTELGVRIAQTSQSAGLVGVAVSRPLLTWHDSGGPRRYSPVRLESTELFLEKHAAVFQNDPLSHADYLSVAGVEAIRRGQAARARVHLWRALRIRPGARNFGRFLVACVPPVARRRWRP